MHIDREKMAELHEGYVVRRSGACFAQPREVKYVGHGSEVASLDDILVNFTSLKAPFRGNTAPSGYSQRPSRVNPIP